MSCAGWKRRATASWPAITASASTAGATSSSKGCAPRPPRSAASTARPGTRRPSPVRAALASRRLEAALTSRRLEAALTSRRLEAALTSEHALLVELRERAYGVVLGLEPRVGRAAVARGEILAREERVRVERLDAAERGDLALNQPVEVPRGIPFSGALHVPEAEVDGPLLPDRVQRKRLLLRTDGTNPHRPQADRFCIELQEARSISERDVDVLDHRLGMQAEDALERLRHADAAVPAHDLRIGARSQALFSKNIFSKKH